MARKTICILIGILVFAFSAICQEEIQLSKRASKKMDKEISKMWPDSEPDLSEISLPYSIRDSHTPGKKIYQINDAGIHKGYLVISSAKGRYDYFDYMVFFDKEGIIQKVRVIEYRSDHGFEITNKKWLSQFNTRNGCGCEYGKDIDAISGATRSATSITEDIGDICIILQQIM